MKFPDDPAVSVPLDAIHSNAETLRQVRMGRLEFKRRCGTCQAEVTLNLDPEFAETAKEGGIPVEEILQAAASEHADHPSPPPAPCDKCRMPFEVAELQDGRCLECRFIHGAAGGVEPVGILNA